MKLGFKLDENLAPAWGDPLSPRGTTYRRYAPKGYAALPIQTLPTCADVKGVAW